MYQFIHFIKTCYYMKTCEWSVFETNYQFATIPKNERSTEV